MPQPPTRPARAERTPLRMPVDQLLGSHRPAGGRLVVSLVWKEAPTRPIIIEQVLERSSAFREAGFDSRVVFALADADVGELATPDPTVELLRARRLSSLVGVARRIVAAPRGSGAVSPILICRGAPAAIAGLIAQASAPSPWAIVYDARGWHWAHSPGRGNLRLKTAAWGVAERLAFRRADHTVAVSSALLGIALALGADPARTTVIPPYTPGPADQAERSGPAADVVYLGNSDHFYQSRELTEPLLTELAKALPEVTFGWLDGAASETPELIASNLWRRRVPPAEVDAHLRSASVGLLIREPTATNAAAFPTKSIQYLAAGCALVTSAYPPSVAELCRATGVGRVVSTLCPSDWAVAVKRALDDGRHPSLDLRSSVANSWVELLRTI